MIESDLQPGDIIFFMNTYTSEVVDGKVEIGYTYVDHVALFAGTHENQPLIIHSISSQSGHYQPDKPSGLCTTTLRALKNQLQQEDGYQDRRYDVTFHVFRNKISPSLAKDALSILETQTKYRIPYDEKRLKDKVAQEDQGVTDDDFKKLGEENYRRLGVYRSIKYAARHPFPLTRTRVNGVGRGLTCSMAAILAYQIAELHEHKYISTPPPKEQWISDKYATLDGAMILSEPYKAYLQSIRKDAYRVDMGSVLSNTFWISKDVTPETYVPALFQVDCKSIGAAGMYAHMKEKKDAWEHLGVLDVCERKFSPIEKEKEKKRKSATFFQSLESIDDITKSSRSIHISPSDSPSPVGKSPALSDAEQLLALMRKEHPWFVEIFKKKLEESNQSDVPKGAEQKRYSLDS